MIPRSPHPIAIVLVRLLPIAAFTAVGWAMANGAHALAQPLTLLALMLAPVLLPMRVLYPPPENPPQNGTDEDGGGRGPGPDPPKPPPDVPGGGIPLPDAEPARTRRRDHDRPALTPRRPRRAPAEPNPGPRRRHLPTR